MQSRGVPKEGALISGTLPSLLNNGLMLVISIFGLLHLLITHDLSNLQAIIFIFSSLLLAGTFIVLLWSLKHRDWLVNLVTDIQKRWAKLRNKEFIPTNNRSSLEQLFKAWDALGATGWLLASRPLLAGTNP